MCQACRVGSAHHNWKGDKVSIEGGHDRARRLYLLTMCESCGKPGRDRHHKDSNTANNMPDNITILCRRCHMKEDGRLAALAALRPESIRTPWRISAVEFSCFGCGCGGGRWYVHIQINGKAVENFGGYDSAEAAARISERRRQVKSFHRQRKGSSSLNGRQAITKH